MDTIWNKALSIIRSEVNEQVFIAWFSYIKEVSVDNSSITLGVVNKFYENLIKEKYLSLIKTAVHQAAGTALAIKFKIDETSGVSADASETPAIDSIPAVPNNSLASSHDIKDKDTPVSWLKSVFGGTRQMPESRYQEIGLNPNYTFENFVVGQSNRFAHAACLAVSEKLAKAYNPLFLYGGVGLGKTHLMQALGQQVAKNYPKIKVLYISSEEFTNQLIASIRTKTTQKFRSMYRNVDILLIDDVQFIAGKDSTQEEFFHTFNALYDAHKQIALCSDRSPNEIKDLEERLVSRFAWGLIADIQLPDFETRIAIMEKKSENEEIKVPQDVLFFLAENIKTNIREMEGALIRVVACAKLTGKTISVPFAREVLKGMIDAEDKKITVDIIQKVVADFYGISEYAMKTKTRTRAIAYPRQVAMYLARGMTDYSLPELGEAFGGRDHTTVLHACAKIAVELKEQDKTKTVIDKLTYLIKFDKKK